VEYNRVHFFRDLPTRDCEITVQRCITLNRAIIDQMVEDMCMTPRTGEEEYAKRAAEVWYSRKVPYGYLHAPFDEICDLSDLPIFFVQEQVKRLVACEPTE